VCGCEMARVFVCEADKAENSRRSTPTASRCPLLGGNVSDRQGNCGSRERLFLSWGLFRQDVLGCGPRMNWPLPRHGCYHHRRRKAVDSGGALARYRVGGSHGSAFKLQQRGTTGSLPIFAVNVWCDLGGDLL
jgi:hypothetical protein